VLETKGTSISEGLKGFEVGKIKCGAAHFAALDSEIIFPNKPVVKWEDVKVKI